MNEPIKTARLELKPYRDGDRARLAELLTNAEIKKTFMIPDFPTEEELTRMLERLQARSQSSEHFERGVYLNGGLIGFVNDVELSGGAIELGYVIDPAYHNQGYATETLQAVIDALLSGGFTTVMAGAFEENLASIRVMEKSGMERISREEDITYQGILRHCVYYAITKPGSQGPLDM